MFFIYTIYKYIIPRFSYSADKQAAVNNFGHSKKWLRIQCNNTSLAYSIGNHTIYFRESTRHTQQIFDS